MKKIFTSVAIAAVAALGFSAAAQTPAPACNKADRGRCEQTVKAPRLCNDSIAEVMIFEGITLTPEQQTKINVIKADRKQKMEARRAEARQAREAARKDRTAAAADRKQCQRDYLAKMKEVLTPEQYVVFLENMVVSQPAPARDGKAAMHRGHKDMKHHGHDRKMVRGERPASK